MSAGKGLKEDWAEKAGEELVLLPWNHRLKSLKFECGESWWMAWVVQKKNKLLLLVAYGGLKLI